MKASATQKFHLSQLNNKRMKLKMAYKEYYTNSEGFYCNWDIIASSFSKHEVATISLRGK